MTRWFSPHLIVFFPLLFYLSPHCLTHHCPLYTPQERGFLENNVDMNKTLLAKIENDTLQYSHISSALSLPRRAGGEGPEDFLKRTLNFRQVRQLQVQIMALRSIREGHAFSETLERSLKSFYQRESPFEWRKVRFGERIDVCTELLETLSCGNNMLPRLPDPQIQKDLSDRFISDDLNTELTSLYAALTGKTDNKVPSIRETYGALAAGNASQQTRIRMLQLHLRDTQLKIRRVVLKHVAPEVYSGQYEARNLRAIALSHRARDKERRKHEARIEKEKKRKRRNFLMVLSAHATKFGIFHREKLRNAKKWSGAVHKYHQDIVRKQESDEVVQQRERIKALREQNTEKYMELVKKAKNERLEKLLRQTESYMNHLSNVILSEQKEDRQAAIASGKRVVQSDIPPEEEFPEAKEGDFISVRDRYYKIAHSIKETVEKQPTKLAVGDLREYQMAGLSWLVSLYNNRLNGILADEMGLGKTIQSVSLIAYLMETKQNYGPFLFIVPMSTLHNNWEYEFDRWLPDCNKIVYDGDKEERKVLREKRLSANNYNVLMTTFEYAMRDKRYLNKIPWEYIIVDEAHRLKNSDCKLAKDLTTYNLKARRVALTGTPLQNDLPELWSLLNFLHPTIFNSVQSFEAWFSSPFDKSGEESSVGEEEKLLVIDRLHTIVRPFMLRREKKDVETQLLDKIERVLRCEMTPAQALMYEVLGSGTMKLANRVMQLRKVCNHPLLFHPYVRNIPGSYQYVFDESIISLSSKFILLDQILTKLKKTNHRVLIFSQMTKVLDVMEDYFAYRGHRFLRLDGSTAAADRSAAVTNFNDENSEYFVFILSTRAGGLGLNLQSADTVILFDSDWNPANDKQAQARAHRIGQKKQVITIRLVTSDTIEEKVVATAFMKEDHEAMVIQAGMFNAKYSADKSRAMLARAIKSRRDEAKDVVNAEAVSKAIARSDEEYRIFREMDHESERGHSLVHPMGHDDYIPEWLFDWLQNGRSSRNCDNGRTLVRDELERVLGPKDSGSGDNTGSNTPLSEDAGGERKKNRHKRKKKDRKEQEAVKVSRGGGLRLTFKRSTPKPASSSSPAPSPAFSGPPMATPSPSPPAGNHNNNNNDASPFVYENDIEEHQAASASMLDTEFGFESMDVEES